MTQQSSCQIADELTSDRDTSKSNCCDDGASTIGNGTDSRFSCNICLEEVSEPVVTRCGHLYCWKCLFLWLEPGMYREEKESLGIPAGGFYGISSNPSRRVCPVCKSDCPLSAVIPVYVRSSPTSRSTRSEPRICKDTAGENDGGQNETEDDGNSNAIRDNESDAGSAHEGLRRRRTNQTSDSSINSVSESERISVPNRPSVSYPQHHQEEPSSPPMSTRSSPGSSPQARASTDNPYRVGGVQLTPRSPNGHNGSLTYGILSSLQRATAEYYRSSNSNNNSNNNEEQERRRIPSLHDRRNPSGDSIAGASGRFGDRYSQDYPQHGESYGILSSETTQYLSRLLIMLTSFVIFCFLMV